MASNSYSVSVPALNFASQEPNFTSQGYHSIALTVGGNIIGRVQNWSVAIYSRTLTHVRELNYQTFGRPVDLVPSINEGYTATGQRAEVWGEELEKACGYTRVFEDLIDQTFPFSIQEVWQKGTAIYRVSAYHGVWFSDTNLDTWDATGDAIVKRAFNVSFVSKRILIS